MRNSLIKEIIKNENGKLQQYDNMMVIIGDDPFCLSRLWPDLPDVIPVVCLLSCPGASQLPDSSDHIRLQDHSVINIVKGIRYIYFYYGLVSGPLGIAEKERQFSFLVAFVWY